MLSLKQEGFEEISEELIRSSTGFGGGIGHSFEICGALCAGVMAVGARYGRKSKDEDRKPAYSRSAELVDAFKERYGTLTCKELVKEFPEFMSPERRAYCAKIVAFMAEEAAKRL